MEDHRQPQGSTNTDETAAEQERERLRREEQKSPPPSSFGKNIFVSGAPNLCFDEFENSAG